MGHLLSHRVAFYESVQVSSKHEKSQRLYVMSVIYLLYLILLLFMDLPIKVAKVCDILIIIRLFFFPLDIYGLKVILMENNTRQRMQERTYSLRDFGVIFDDEILRLYHGQIAANQNLQQTQRQNSFQRQRIQQSMASQQGQQRQQVPQQGQQQQQVPQQNQIRQKNQQ